MSIIVSMPPLAGRYQLGEVLGEGGMGQVWRARDLQLGREVAVKVLHAHALGRADAIARLEREARIGAGLTHPGIVGTLDFGRTEDGVWYVVMQLVPGGDLLAYRNQHHPLDLATLVAFGYQLADALAAAHAQQVIHRDLKPENILLDGATTPPTLRIADFGLAYSLGTADPRQGRLTVDGSVGGTPEYMAPEQATGAELGPSADIYALGCVLFDVATGEPPFASGGVGRILASHLYTPPPRLHERRPDLPPALDELIDRMLAKAPGDRPTAVAVRKRLAALDASALGPGARARDAGFTSDRADRMISGFGAPMAAPSGATTLLAIDGEVDREILGALRAAGVERAASPDATRLRLVVGGSLERIAEACSVGAVVIADATRSDFTRISDLLRLGVAEIVFLPMTPADVVRRVHRAARNLSRPGA